MLCNGAAQIFPQILKNKTGDGGSGLLVLRSGTDEHHALIAVAVTNGHIAHAVLDLDVACALHTQQLVDVLDIHLIAQNIANPVVQLCAAVGITIGADNLSGFVRRLVVLAGDNLVAGVHIKHQFADCLVESIQIVVDAVLCILLHTVQPLLLLFDGNAQLFGGLVVLVQLQLVVVLQLLCIFRTDRAVRPQSAKGCKHHCKSQRNGEYPFKSFQEQNEDVLKGNFLSLNALMHKMRHLLSLLSIKI